MSIVWRNPDELIPYERNQKKHDEKQIRNVANSIKRFGWKQPIVIDKKDVVVIPFVFAGLPAALRCHRGAG